MKNSILQILFLGLISTYSYGQKINDNRMTLDFIPYCSDKTEPVEKPIQTDWVNKDTEIIKNQINKIPENSSTIQQIKTVVPHLIDEKCNCRSSTYDLGYGLKSTLHTIHGGYGSFNVDVLYFNDLILKIRLTIENQEEILEEFLVEQIKLPFTCLDGLPAYEIQNTENIESYQKKFGKIFIESTDQNLKRRDALNYFTNIYNGSEFDKPYHITFGLGSETFDYIRYFIVNKDYVALEDLIYSPSPTGRLFSASTLNYLDQNNIYEPNRAIKNRVDEILTTAEPIKSGIISCWTNKFDYDYYDVAKDFAELLKTI